MAELLHTLAVNLDHYTYPIFIGDGLQSDLQWLTRYIPGQQVLIVTNTTLASLLLDTVKLAFPKTMQVDSVVLPDGEAYKTLETVNLIFDALLTKRHRRNTTLIALGGGVIGDMTGFAAASYQRGVAFIQMPTTLLSQVDSSVGGKTGVNHALGKNMIGAFYQPHCVIADVATLRTLPEREFRSGLAEVIKYGLIYDAEFFNWLEQNMTALLEKQTQALAYAIYRSCQIKAITVQQDEKEQGIRAHLNLGHTFGHAIENVLGYGEWLHGEAVAAGMVLAAKLSQRQGFISRSDVQRIELLLQQAHLPIAQPAKISAEALLAAMRLDKKNRSAQIRLILLKKMGEACITETVTDDALMALLTENAE